MAAAQQQKTYARSVHQIMVSILKARFAAENAQGDPEVADRGSEADASMETTNTHTESIH